MNRTLQRIVHDFRGTDGELIQALKDRYIVDKVAVVRSIAECVREDQRPRSLVECVKVLEKTRRSGVRPAATRPLVDWLVENEMRMVVADKEGHFVVLPEGLYGNKVKEAVKNF
ncbi:hypothetical protein HPB52_003194 [Rhipicephalus sanguineus]|uniref:Uncharacterized protein n=1 Tax=Rhipicephalus sanguineus TaxID=34632 RepID=A0A9D4PL80_RHISA|nr:hypothetical protein HPB52_003194 [Rhipicephalus sanguineus]